MITEILPPNRLSQWILYNLCGWVNFLKEPENWIYFSLLKTVVRIHRCSLDVIQGKILPINDEKLM
jgi:hypothetical protein